MTYRHGTTSRYTTGGCHCDLCRAAGTLQRNRWKVKAARGIPPIVPAGRTGKQIADLHRVMDYRQMSARSGVDRKVLSEIARGVTHSGGRGRDVKAETAAKLNGLWETYCAPVEPDRRRYPVGPLRDVVVRRFGSLQAAGETDSRTIQRAMHTGLTSAAADRLAVKYGQMPGDLWADYGQPEIEEVG